MSRTVRLVQIGLIALTTGCYEYQSSDVGRVQPGQIVQVTLTPTGSAALAASIGPSATSLDGRVLARDDNDVTLALVQITRSVGQEQFLHDEPLSFSLSNIESWRVRTFDKSRTALAVGGILAAVIGGRAFIDQSSLFGGRIVGSQSTK